MSIPCHCEKNRLQRNDERHLSLKSPFSADCADCGKSRNADKNVVPTGLKMRQNGRRRASFTIGGLIHRQQVKIGASVKRKGKNREIP